MKPLYDALREDHRRLDEVFETLLNCVHAGEREAAREAWTAFERGLTGHMAAEEATLLPVFDQFEPEEAARVRAEHLRIRTLLDELGVALDLHALREEKVEELVAALRAHAAHEEAGLYPWADQALPEPAADALRKRLAAAGDLVRRAAHKLLDDGPPVL